MISKQIQTLRSWGQTLRPVLSSRDQFHYSATGLVILLFFFGEH